MEKRVLGANNQLPHPQYFVWHKLSAGPREVGLKALQFSLPSATSFQNE